MPRIADPHRRDAILEAARQTIERDGFADARMSDIARRAKMAVGTLYLYFDSKESLARALAGATFARAASVILAVLEKPLTRARVATLVRRTFDVVLDDQSVGRLGIPLADAAPTLAPEAYATVVSQLAWALDRQMEQGHIRRYDAVTLADYVAILVRRAVLQSAANGGKREPYQSTAAELLAAALLPAAAAATR